MIIEQTFSQLSFLPQSWPPLLKANTFATIFLLLSTLVLVLVILLLRFRDGFRFANTRWMNKKAQQFITTYMFNEDLGQVHADKFRKKHLKTYARRQVFTDALIQLRKNIVGEFSDRLRLLYLQIGLHAHSKQKLYTNSWNIIADGINELAEMDMQQDVSVVRGFINHQHPNLRSVAQVAYLRLLRDAPFSFLDELQEPLLEWQQMQLASAAHKAHITMPAFKRWLYKKETSIVIFCIRMIALHNQHNASAELTALLSHSDIKVREEAIKAIRILEAQEATEALLQLYSKETTELKLEILKALAVIGDEALLPFYEHIMLDSENCIQVAAAEAMARAGMKGQEALLYISNDIGNMLQPLAASVLKSRR